MLSGMQSSLVCAHKRVQPVSHALCGPAACVCKLFCTCAIYNTYTHFMYENYLPCCILTLVIVEQHSVI